MANETQIDVLRGEIDEYSSVIDELDEEFSNALDAFLDAGKALRAARKRIATLRRMIEKASNAVDAVECQLDEHADRILELEAELADMSANDNANESSEVAQ